MERVEPIAIIGIGCRFPQADNPSAFWRLLRDGVDAITEVPAERWNAADFFHEDAGAPGKTNTRWGGFLRELEQFDPDSFRISPREARRMDPQQRILLEVAWEALEDAGQPLERLAGTRAGIFVGVMNNDYARIHLEDLGGIDTYIGAGSSSAIVANRVSYLLDLQGPSMVVDTLCSSSLVAVHLACQSLWNGESSPVALAGGVNIMLLPTMNIFYTKSGLTAPDGRCKSFDARADGIVRGEGAGVVVLKPLARALADNDRVYCVIRGSAVNQDGRSNGLTAPSRWSQMAVLREAYRRAGVSPGRVQYVETHGTGTRLGDPIEVAALGEVLAADRAPHDACALGSVKTNFGHLESAAGIASLIKTALALEHREIPPSLHFQNPNPYIPFAQLPLRVQRELGPWPSGPTEPLAGVSSFGLGGTNAHVVLEAAPRGGGGHAHDAAAGLELTDEVESETARLFTLSARSPEALASLGDSYREFLAAGTVNSAPSLRDLCYTQGERRTQHPFRLALVARSVPDLSSQLGARGSAGAGARAAAAPASSQLSPSAPPAFVFCGQGALLPQSGLELLTREPRFGATFRRCSELYGRLAGVSLLTALRAADERTLAERTDLAQPLLFALQVSLAELWRAWGVEPGVVVGHSVGEVAAAHVAGVLSLEDAVLVVYHRGRLMQPMSGRGRMLAVGLSVEEVEREIAGYGEHEVVVATHNGPRACVLGGLARAVEEVSERLKGRGVPTQRLNVEYGFHTPMMGELRGELCEALSGLKVEAARIPIVSTVGEAARAEAAAGGGRPFDASYWAEQVRARVEFAAAMKEVMRGGAEKYVEVGPQAVLRGAMRQCWEEVKREKAAGREAAGAGPLIVSSVERGGGERESMLRAAGELWERGQGVEWREVNGAGRCVALPGYAWQRRLCWDEGRGGQNGVGPAAGSQAPARAQGRLLGKGLKSAIHAQTYFWDVELDAEAQSYLEDHRVQDALVLPASAYAEMALEAASEIFGAGGPHHLEQVSFEHALLLPDDGPRGLQLVVTVEEGGRARFQFFGPEQETGGARTRHARGMIVTGSEGLTAPALTQDAPEEVRRRCAEVVSGAEFYEAAERRGLQYGPGFRLVEQVWRRDGEALARLKSQDAPGADAFHAHPALLDACFQSLTGALSQSSPDGAAPTYLPFGLGGLWIHARPSAGRWCHALLRPGAQSGNGAGAELLTGDLFLLDDDGGLLLEARGLQAKRVRQSLRRAAGEDVGDWFYQLRWQALELPPEVEAAASGLAERRGGWLVFADGQGVGEALALRLKGLGHHCTLVYPGEAFELNGPGRYVIDPSSPGDLSRLLHEVFGAERPECRGVLHLWGSEAESPEELTTERLEALQAKGCLSVLQLVQALCQVGWREPPALWLLTRGAQAVGGQAGSVSVAQSPLWGLGRTIVHEHPKLQCRLVDLCVEERPGVGTDEAELLFREVLRPGSEGELAIRGGKFFAPRFERAAAPGGRAAEGDAPAVEFRPDASYLITGGLGALGLVVARWMAERGARHLVLLGRSEPSESARRAVDSLREMGCEVLTCRADVARGEELAAVLTKVRETLPGLRGVVHAAGVVDDRIMLQLDEGRFRRVMAPKVSAAWNLHRQTLGDQLDFFVLFSSLASVLGSAGQSNYAAANAFLDTLASYRSASGRPALSINWGPWSEVGMAAGLRESLALKGFEAITPQEGTEALERLLRGGAAQVGVLRRAADTRPRPASRPGATSSADADAPSADGPPAFRRRLDAAAPEERRDLLLAHVRGEVSRILGLDANRQPEVNRGLFDMGMDSLMAVELGRSLQSGVGHAFPVTSVFNHPTVESLAEYLCGELFPPEPAAAAAETDEAPGDLEQLSLDDLEQLSEEEALQLLTEKLTR